MPYYVYILKGASESIYIGCTNDLDARLKRHNQGDAPSTKALRPLEVVTHIVFNNKEKAYAFEKYLKSGSGRAFLRKRLI